MSHIRMNTMQRRSPREDSAGREQLVAAAAAVMQRDGPAAATSRAIADMNLGSITYYFGSKDTLVAEALAESGRHLLQPALDALRSAESPVEQLLRTTQLLPTRLADHLDEARGYAHALAASTHDPAVRAALAEVHGQMEDALAAAISEFRSSGVIPEWVDGPAMAATIVALVAGVAVTKAAEVASRDANAVSGQFAGLLIDAARAAD